MKTTALDTNLARQRGASGVGSTSRESPRTASTAGTDLRRFAWISIVIADVGLALWVTAPTIAVRRR